MTYSRNRPGTKRFTAALALLAAIAFWHVNERPAQDRVIAYSQDAPTLQKQTPVEVPRALLRAGTEFEYDFERRIDFDSSLLPSGTPVAYQGTLVVRILKKKKDGWTGEAELLSENSKSISSARIEISQELRLSKMSGRLEDESGWALKDALASWAFFHNEDTSGRYRARLTRDQNLWAKTKIGYIAVPSAPTIVSSIHKMAWNANFNVPQTLDGNEVWQIEKKGGLLSLNYRLSLIATRSNVTAKLVGHLPDSKLPHSLTDDHQSEIHTKSPARSWHELIGALVWSDSLTGQQRLTLFSDLLAYLKTNPGYAAELESLARKNAASNSRSYSIAIGTLATNGSPEAQASLRSLYEDPAIPEAAKGQILSAWTTTDRPLDEATRALLRRESESGLNKSLSTGATFALGSAMRSGPDRQSIESIKRSHTTAENMRDRESAIEAMGNSGSTAFLGSIQHELAGGDERIRASAAFSLRFIPGDEARSALSSALKDKDSKVRASAAEALRFRPVSEKWSAPLQQCSTNDPEAVVRDVCRQVIQSVQNEGDENS